MKAIKITRYMATDGSVWNSKDDCKKRDIKLDWENNIPKEVSDIYQCIIDIFKVKWDKTNVENWFILEPADTDDLYLGFIISLRFNCGNPEIIKAIGELYILLSSLPNSYLRIYSDKTSIFIDKENCLKDLSYLNEVLLRLKK